jgi:hypothetical protein
LAETQFNNFISYSFPGNIANEINKQLPGYLNNVQMQQILTNHSHNLNQTLLSPASETLNRLVNEPQYQVVTTAHLNSIQQKCDNKIVEIRDIYEVKLQENNRTLLAQIRDMKSSYESNITQLKDKLDNVNKLVNKVSQLGDENSSLRWMLVELVFFSYNCRRWCNVNSI